ncbi:metallophosphoesterase family protein [Bacillus cereus]
MTFPDKTVSTKGGRITFTLESSLDWLEKDLEQASVAGKPIVINLHEPDGWGWNPDTFSPSKYPNLESGPNQRFINLLKTYDVKAVFAGHHHEKYGLYETDYKQYFGDVPVFLSGSAPNKTYLIAEYKENELKVYGVKNNDWKNKSLLKTIDIHNSNNIDDWNNSKPSNNTLQTIDKGFGQLYFSILNGTMNVAFDKSGFGISYNDKKWDLIIDGKTAYTFSELTPVNDVATAINQLHLSVKNGFSLIQK